MVLSDMGQEMNLVCIHTHDTGRYMTPYGYAALTPAIQEFAEDAMVFRKAFCVSPACTPSRGAMMTGTYPHCNGLMGLAHRGFSLKRPHTHLAVYLRTQGYQTVLAGVQHESGFWMPGSVGRPAGEFLGYDKILTDFTMNPRNGQDYLQWDKNNCQAVCRFLRSYKSDRPFYLSYGLYSTHRPYPEPDMYEQYLYDARYVHLPYGMEDTPENRSDMAGFLKSLHGFDMNLGAVLDTVKQCGFYEDTILMVTTDHGTANPFTKCFLNDAGTGTALIMRVPGHTGSHGQVSDALISQLDVFPTLCSLLGLAEPSWLQGKSFAPCFDNPGWEGREELIQEMNFHTSYEPARSVRSRRYRYVRYLDGEWPYYNISNCDESPAKGRLLLHGWGKKKKQQEYLFDLVFDPEEKVNLAEEEEYKDVIDRFRGKLESFRERTGDYLLTSEEYKACYRVNRKECTFPSIRIDADRES